MDFQFHCCPASCVPATGNPRYSGLGGCALIVLFLSPWQAVTKGARNKIILSITKLARRPETLLEIEQVATL